MIVAGLDTASDRWHTVWGAGGSGPAVPEQCKVGGRKMAADERRIELTKAFKVRVYQWDQMGLALDMQVHIFCEEPLALQNPKTSRVLSLAAGALWHCHVDYSVWWHWVDVSAWQSHHGLRGKSPERKAQIREIAIKAGMADNLDEDHYDAWGVREWGVAQLAAA